MKYRFTSMLAMLATPVFFVQAARSDIRIEEVLFDPVKADTGFEYIVIKNVGSSVIDMAGWNLYADSAGYFVFPKFSLEAGKGVTLYLRKSGSDNSNSLYQGNTPSNMGNTSGSVALFSSNSHSDATLVDFLEYGKAGETWESTATKAKLWTKGEYISLGNFQEGQVLRRGDGAYGAQSWHIVSKALPPQAAVPQPKPHTKTTVVASPPNSSTQAYANKHSQTGVDLAPPRFSTPANNTLLLVESLGGGVLVGIFLLYVQKRF